MVVAVVVVGIGVVVLLGVAPFLLPWHTHVRWLAATVTAPIDPWGIGAGLSSSTGCDVVTLGRVDPGPEAAVNVESIAAGHVGRLQCPSGTSTDLARLARWAAARTPLLMVTDRNDEVSLHGPNFAVVGLRSERQRAVDHPGGERPSLGEITAGDLELLGLAMSPAVNPQVRYR